MRQANTRYLLGLRASGADFGLQQVGNTQCLSCHDGPDERHPAFRWRDGLYSAYPHHPYVMKRGLPGASDLQRPGSPAPEPARMAP